MTVAPSRTWAIAEGFARLLADGDIGLSWDPDANYNPTQIGIFIRDAPAEMTELITISPSLIAQHPVFTDDVERVTIRYRSGTRVSRLWATRDAVRAYLRGRFPIVLPTGVYVAALDLATSADLGRDADRRWSWSDSYTVRVGTVRPV